MTTSIAILAKAPVPGYAKTRLIPSIGAHAAARLQDAFTERTVQTAQSAHAGPVTLWCAPDPSHPSFLALARQFSIVLKRQPVGDLGVRMLAASAAGPTVILGTDCPALTAQHVAAAAEALRQADVVVTPADDGGYVLIGTQRPQPELFEGIAWGGSSVMEETRARIARLALRCVEFEPLWDVDTEADLARAENEIAALF